MFLQNMFRHDLSVGDSLIIQLFMWIKSETFVFFLHSLNMQLIYVLAVIKVKL